MKNSLASVPDDMHTEEQPEVFFESVSGERYKVKVRFWCNIYKTEQVTSEVRMALYKGFGAKEIVMEE